MPDATDKLARCHAIALAQWERSRRQTGWTDEDADILSRVSRHAYRHQFLNGGTAEFSYFANLNR